MTIVLDTTVLIDWLRGLPAAENYLLALAEPAHCSEVTRVEIMQGLRSSERRAVERLFAALDWVAVGEEIARTAGDLGRRYRQSHRLGIADLVVAATAQQLGTTVVTTNVRHFPMFASLRPPYT